MTAVGCSISHDVLQAMCGDLQGTHTGQGEQGLEPPLPFEDIQQAAGVACRIAPEARHDFLITAAFALARGLAVGPPDQRVEPPENLSDELQPAQECVPPANVDELVGQDQLELIGAQMVEQGTGQEHRGPEQTEGRRSEWALGHEKMNPTSHAQSRGNGRRLLGERRACALACAPDVPMTEDPSPCHENQARRQAKRPDHGQEH